MDSNHNNGDAMSGLFWEEQERIIQRDIFLNGHPGNGAPSNEPAPTAPGKKEKPTHYKVVSISLYLDDIKRIDALVKELKRRGFTKMNRSALIRFAIDTVDIDQMPRQY